MTDLFPRIQCPHLRNKHHHPLLHLFNPSRPWSLLLILLLLFSTNNSNNNKNQISISIFGKSITLSPSSPSGIQLTSAQTTLQGYIYWDVNSNGLLDNTELFTGVVDTTVQLRSCTKNGATNNNHKVVAETLSNWHPLNPGTKFPGHNEIYPNGGYYSFDINNSNSAECLLSDEEIRNGASTTTMGGGCFVSVSALDGFQITSSFPLRHFNYHEREFDLDNGLNNNDVGESFVNDVNSGGSNNNNNNDPVVFDWIPYQDVMPNYNNDTTTTTQSLSSLLNRGYHARTSQCFGYHPNKRTWYIYNTQSSSQATPLQTPNGAQFGYNTLIYGESGSVEKDVYDTTLSLTPIGMSESRWPLELRVSTDVNVAVDTNDGGHENNGGLILGLKLDSDRTTGDYVLLSDSGNLSEGKGASSNNNGGGEGGGEPRYEFVSRDGSNFLSALSHFRDVGGVDIDGDVNANDGVITVNNRNGILENPTVMIDVLQSFLWERGNLHKLEGGDLELVGLTVVLINQWSLITVVDKAEETQELVGEGNDVDDSPSSSTQELIISTGMNGKRSLRGLPLSQRSGNMSSSTTSNRNLRGESQQYYYSSSTHRNTIALPEPHLVFEFAVYAKYRENGDESNQNEIATKVSSNFGDIVSDTCNSRRQSLIARIRGRSGYFQGCNPKKQSNNDDSGDGSVTYTAFGGSDKEYVEIDIGVVNRFDCDKLLPLYYFEMETLAVRRIIDDSLGMLSRQGEVLSLALQLLQLDDGYYVLNDAQAPNDSSNTTAIVSASVVVSILLIATIVAVWYVRKERRKLREERERRRKAKEAKLAERKARRRRKSEKSFKKQARAKKKSVAPSTVSNDGVEAAKVDEGAERAEAVTSKIDNGGGKDLETNDEGDKKPPDNEGVKRELDDDSDDSELERLFDKPSSELQSRSEEDVRPIRQRRRRKKKTIDSESGSESDFNASSQRRRERRRRRRKKGDVGSETDSKATDQSASNVSGMNNTTSSKDEHQSTDKTPVTRSQSSNHESDPVSNKAEDEDSDPPTRIEVSQRGALEKGISDISLGLVASLKKSFTRAAATLNDLKEDSEVDDNEKAVKSAEDKSSDPSREKNKDETTRVRRRRPTLTKAMSSFRKSSTGTKANDGVERRRGGRPSLSRAMSSFRKSPNDSEGGKISKRPAPRRMLSKMGMSMRSIIIGELSSSSDDDSSSDSSSSDSDSSSSSDSSEDLKQKRTTKRAGSHNDSKEIKSIRRKASDIDNSGRRKHRRRGGRQAGEEKGGLEESGKMSRTNEYLPDKLDAKLENGSTAAVALPQSKPAGLSLADDSSNAAVAIMKPPSERSLGSKTKSSKSNSDSHRAEAGSKRTSKEERRANRERRRKDRSSRDLPSKKTGRRRKESDKNISDKRPLRRSNSRKALDSLRSSLTRSFSGKILSQPAKSALESEGEDVKKDKRESRHSSKKRSSHKHRHRSKDAEKGSHRSKHHRTEGPDRAEKASDRNSERNSERATRKRRSRKRHSEESSDRDTERSASNRERSQRTSPHRKTKSSSSKHASRKKSSGEGERGSRRRTTESANQK